MAGVYVPPHLRGSAKSPSSELPSVKTERKSGDEITFTDIRKRYPLNERFGTLNRASTNVEDWEEYHTLGFIIVFEGPHPKWPPTIYCKAELKLLPKAEDRLPSAPVPVFIETSHEKYREQTFLYAGMHTITRVEYLEPHSDGLLEMLNTKYTDKSKLGWERSLTMSWAVVDLTKVEATEDVESNLMEPLKEMRLQDSDAKIQNEKSGLEEGKKEVPGEEDKKEVAGKENKKEVPGNENKEEIQGDRDGYS